MEGLNSGRLLIQSRREWQPVAVGLFHIGRYGKNLDLFDIYLQ